MGDVLEQLLARLPRVGEATASRLARAIGEQPEDYRRALARAIEAREPLRRCSGCGDTGECGCDRGEPGAILVVETPGVRARAVLAWPGRYHVLGALLPDGALPWIRVLLERCRDPGVTELILALGRSPEARATEVLIANGLRGSGVAVSAIERGMGWGREIEHAGVDEVRAALVGRRPLC